MGIADKTNAQTVKNNDKDQAQTSEAQTDLSRKQIHYTTNSTTLKNGWA